MSSTMSWLKVPVTGGSMIIDLSSWDLYANNRWHLATTGYISRKAQGKRLFFHRLVNATPAGLHTDHINRIKTDNRANNLRSVTHKENMQNKAHRGYWHNKKQGTWVVETHEQYWGYYPTEEEAQAAVKDIARGVTPKKYSSVREDIKSFCFKAHHEYKETGFYINKAGSKVCRECNRLRAREARRK